MTEPTEKKQITEAELKSMGFKTKEMYEFPNIVNVQVYSGNCPCKCVHCPVGSTEPKEREDKFGNKSIDLGLYQKIVSEIAGHPSSTIRIHSVGEPLLWENLPKAMNYTKEKGVRSWLFTSAVTSDKGLLESLCRDTDIVEVSVNSADSENYRSTKGINAFELVSANIGYMHDFIKGNNLQTRLIASRVQTTSQEMDEDFVNYWKNLGVVDDAFVRSYHTYNDIMAQLKGEGIPPTHEPCLVHWARFNISTDGYAVVCFNELFKKELHPSLVLGDVNKTSIQDIWHGEKLSKLRKAELSKDYSGLESPDKLPCKDCTACQPLFGNRQTSEHQVTCKQTQQVKQ